MYPVNSNITSMFTLKEDKCRCQILVGTINVSQCQILYMKHKTEYD